MKHYGDITQLSGYDLPVVDVIIGGSPCQDLSVAGKREGLKGQRSGLFMEQVRIVKEMRKKDGSTGRAGFLVRPRYLVWENVPGALSSGNPKGADFQAVLEEICKIVCEEAPPVPIPKEGWPKAGCISGVGDSGCTFSVCWRLHDAQFWGVPQRRKRIALVADFGGLSAPEILFERKGLSGDPEPRGAQGEGTPERTEGSLAFSIQGNTIDRDVKQNGGGISVEVAHTLNSVDRHASAYGFDGSMGAKAGNIGYEEEMAMTTKSTGGGHCMILETGNEQGQTSGS